MFIVNLMILFEISFLYSEVRMYERLSNRQCERTLMCIYVDFGYSLYVFLWGELFSIDANLN